MNLGYIDYLNCYPFYHDLFENPHVEGIHITPGYPEQLNALMKAGELDMSPISAAAYAELQADTVLLPQFCLSSIGYVGSVVLASNHPIENLHGKRVGISEASRTSEMLLKILLKKHYGITPCYFKIPPRPDLTGMDAALIIGNDAMVNSSAPIPYIYDIGDLWLRKTGYPVVFAVFAVKQSAIRENAETIRAVVQSFQKSLAFMKTNKKGVTEAAGRKYADIDYDIDTYYDLLKFDFSDDLKTALSYYYRTAAQQGLLAPVSNIRFLTEDLTVENYPTGTPGDNIHAYPKKIHTAGR